MGKKRSEHITVHKVECESTTAFCRKKGMLLCMSRSVTCAQWEWSLSSTDDICQHSSWA